MRAWRYWVLGVESIAVLRVGSMTVLGVVY